MLDLFGGSGALGIEALSRGALKAVFNDIDPACRRIIAENLKHTGMPEKAIIFGKDALILPEILKKAGYIFNIIFLDPPYRKNLINNSLKVMVENGIIYDDGLVVAEHAADEAVIVPPEAGLEIIKQKTYGDTMITLIVKRIN